jgi:hypothetical protein
MPFDGSSVELGRYLTAALKLAQSRDAQAGAVFEVQELQPAVRVRRKIRATAPSLRATKPDESTS